MFSVAPNILLAPNMTQNAERKHRTQNTNTAHFRSSSCLEIKGRRKGEEIWKLQYRFLLQKFHVLSSTKI